MQFSFISKHSVKVLADLKKHLIPLLVIIGCTVLFFWPLITRIDSYSEGGDAMFNAWTLARNHNCILGNNCSDYSNGNIFYPEKDSMLFSEAQLSTGLLTLPLYFINNNPLFAYNFMTITTFVLSAFFMYLLAMHISKGNKPGSLIAGLIFGFAPIKIIAMSHLQNLSIFYLPLILLLLLKYYESKNKKYLIYATVMMSFQFYAAWYNAVFVTMFVSLLLVLMKLYKLIDKSMFYKSLAALGVAGLSTLPLAIQYLRFSQSTNAGYSLSAQVAYSSSLLDYFRPPLHTFSGDVFYGIFTNAKTIAFNLDGSSYHSVFLIVLLFTVFALSIKHAFKKRKKNNLDKISKQTKLIYAFAIAGFFFAAMSLGPVLKVGDKVIHFYIQDTLAAIPLPYAAISFFVPQLSFIRAVGRISVLVLLACSAIFVLYWNKISMLNIRKSFKILLYSASTALLIFELAPNNRYILSNASYAQNIEIPEAYRYIKNSKDIHNIYVLATKGDYDDAPFPVAIPEMVMWAGYHNKNIFNGYSGYFPTEHSVLAEDFLDFQVDDIDKIKALGIDTILINTKLSANIDTETDILNKSSLIVYSDEDYIVYVLL